MHPLREFQWLSKLPQLTIHAQRHNRALLHRLHIAAVLADGQHILPCLADWLQSPTLCIDTSSQQSTIHVTTLLVPGAREHGFAMSALLLTGRRHSQNLGP